MYKGNRNQPKLRGRRTLVAENEKRHLTQQDSRPKESSAPPPVIARLPR